ncbi:hypothetical protein MAGR_56910 [Mycolicibacterium agri]|uniref:DUF4333 domain-containing protein n=2 Tax=Mycolicibacterium agri TaxID=36811 RepID=A0A7I9W9I2_MYCAG|nr:hypothetical protein MAGR_56910 [Mycolicibacterium agri]
MKKMIVSASTVGAAGVAIGALGLFGAGIASAAPDVVGMTYGDAVSEIEDGGGTAKIAVTVGDRQDAMGDCLVTNATDAPFVRDSEGEFGHADSEVLLTLNCNRGAATATTPGASLGSPAGRDFQAKAEAAAEAAQNEQDELTQAGELPGDTEPEIPTG